MENLDFNELQAVLDDMTMAIAKHYPYLSKYAENRATSPSAAPPAAL
jgi:hypothetical protein